jgi:uncharacterized delta-60 repeat protein
LVAAASAAALLVTLMATALAYASSAGELDRSFGNHGRVVPWDIHVNASSTAIGRKGRIVVSGTHRGEFVIARLRHDGSLDRSFGQNGIASIPSREPKARATSVTIKHNGGVVVAGTACYDRGICHLVVIRLTADGRLYRQFGDDGLVRIDFGRQLAIEPSVAVAPHRQIIVKATQCPAGNGDGPCDIGVARLSGDGSLYTKFGDHGKALTPPYDRRPSRCAARHAFASENVDSMALDSRGRIVVLLTCSYKTNLALARFNRNGDLDRSFGNGGIVQKELHMKGVASMTTDLRNRIDVAGWKPNGFSVARLRPNAKPDRSFGERGTATAKFARDPSSPPVPYSIAVDSKGRIVAGGGVRFGLHHPGAGAFARFKPNGKVNRRFGRRGTKIVDRGLNFVDSISIDSRNRIVGAGDAVVRLLG